VSFDMTHLLRAGLTRAARGYVAALLVLTLADAGTTAQAGTATANLTVQITITDSCTINVARATLTCQIGGASLHGFNTGARAFR